MKLNEHSGRAVLTLATFVAMVLLGCASDAKAQAYQVIYEFPGSPNGWLPAGVPAIAKNGDMYGVTVSGGTSNMGTVFELTAPRTRGGAWTETVLYNVTDGDPGFPTSLIISKDGTLFGAGGGPDIRGFIFRLSPPAPGKDAWTYDTLYVLDEESDGSAIQGNLVLDAQGNIYGATELGGDPNCAHEGCGTVFELERPTKDGGKWRFSVLYTFTQQDTGIEPFAGVTFDQKGNIYGTTNYGGTFGYGTAYRLTPPKKKGRPWTETILYSFDQSTNIGSSPEAPVILDESGNVYGTTAFGGDLNCQSGYGCGVVFELSPPAKKGGAWTYATLYAFQAGNDGDEPSGYMVFDSEGNLYGTTQYGGGQADGGAVYSLSPPANGDGAWTEIILHAFTGSNGDGATPIFGLTWGKWHELYGEATEGGTGCEGSGGCGMVFELQP